MESDDVHITLIGRSPKHGDLPNLRFSSLSSSSPTYLLVLHSPTTSGDCSDLVIHLDCSTRSDPQTRRIIYISTQVSDYCSYE